MARPPSKRQIEKNARVRQQLLKSALKVVGKLGYAKASIAKIAETAKVSTGTFYLHFTSKEELYNELLPWANIDVTRFIEKRVTDATCYMDFEERNISSFFEYLSVNQAFLTVLMEAEVAAPGAWQSYTDIREANYLARLEAAWDRDELPDFGRSDIPQISTMLIGMRRNVVVRYSDRRKWSAEAIQHVIETYLAFVFGALHRSNGDRIAELWRYPAALAPRETQHHRQKEAVLL